MAKPQVTITLGSSGQKVVKDSWGVSDGSRADAAGPIGSKRTLAESFGSSAYHAFNSSKRMRDGESGSSYGYSSHADDAHLGSKDLCLKLTHRRILREVELKNEGHKGIELREKVLRASRSAVKLLKRVPHSIRAAETPNMDSMRNSYASWSSTGGGTRSPERILRSSGGLSNPRSATDELPQVPSARPFNTSRMECALTSNPLVSSRPNVPMITGLRRARDTGKLPMELPTVAGSISRTPYQSSYVPKDSRALTISSFLHSLGLGKYFINFQAEEIVKQLNHLTRLLVLTQNQEMDSVMKQMREIDLKELGIPMGPRKKILHALLARRSTLQL
ncbi:hypothetical protein C2S53_000210 [Perilla frutescens var. hirtella]|uniref:SAM domain-containing protein n=1 Tax=Perilla frutescens var. hirtella TaxID=608512 RepID=A0AAD4JB89_PERFH|nr:hypothetical protein C2S53_000210 [Perilla frutescens var. hirtella]